MSVVRGSGHRRSGVADIVLASGSRYRAGILSAAGIPVEIDPPAVDERSLDARLAEIGPERLAVELATLKAREVQPRHPGSFVVAADQLGVLTGDDGRCTMLTKRGDVQGAVEQLLQMAGRTHRLVNGLVVLDPGGVAFCDVDVQTIRMRHFDERDARAYVERFTPFDTTGSYRLEDDALLESERAGSGLLAEAGGDDPTGVIGLPLGLLRRLLSDAGAVV